MQVRILFWLNMADLFMTLYGLKAGYIEEANPLMEALYQVSPILFLGVKFMVVLAVLSVIHYGINLSERKRLLKMLLYIPIAIYCVVDLLNFYYYIIISAKLLQ